VSLYNYKVSIVDIVQMVAQRCPCQQGGVLTLVTAAAADVISVPGLRHSLMRGGCQFSWAVKLQPFCNRFCMDSTGLSLCG